MRTRSLNLIHLLLNQSIDWYHVNECKDIMSTFPFDDVWFCDGTDFYENFKANEVSCVVYGNKNDCFWRN